MFPVVMVGESAGMSSTVCGGSEDMFRPRLGAGRDWRALAKGDWHHPFRTGPLQGEGRASQTSPS
jgi:hypothetical protein